MLKKPLIGITLDSNDPGGYSKYPWYALRENYCSSLVDMGATPFPLTHDNHLVDSYLSLIDGLLVTGGDYDLDPNLYGETTVHPTVKVKPRRTNFEMAITRAALDKNIPILGICGGHQLINVTLGGTLIQHIPEENPEALPHIQSNPPHEHAHSVKIIIGTHLHQIVGTETLNVNTSHHQAVKKLGNGVVLNALAPDGVIEGLEVPAYKFCLGVQWHPEFTVTPQDSAILRAFVEASRG